MLQPDAARLSELSNILVSAGARSGTNLHGDYRYDIDILTKSRVANVGPLFTSRPRSLRDLK